MEERVIPQEIDYYNQKWQGILVDTIPKGLQWSAAVCHNRPHGLDCRENLRKGYYGKQLKIHLNSCKHGKTIGQYSKTGRDQTKLPIFHGLALQLMQITQYIDERNTGQQRCAQGISQFLGYIV